MPPCKSSAPCCPVPEGRGSALSYISSKQALGQDACPGADPQEGQVGREPLLSHGGSTVSQGA